MPRALLRAGAAAAIGAGVDIAAAAAAAPRRRGLLLRILLPRRILLFHVRNREAPGFELRSDPGAFEKVAKVATTLPPRSVKRWYDTAWIWSRPIPTATQHFRI